MTPAGVRRHTVVSAAAPLAQQVMGPGTWSKPSAVPMDACAFVWSMIGALSQVTSLPITTLVTCPTVRINPAVNAQAAATAAVLSGELPQILPTPAHFEQASTLVTEEMVADAVVCGDNADAHLTAVTEFADAGFDEVYVNQIGSDHDGFFDFYRTRILPRLH